MGKYVASGHPDRNCPQEWSPPAVSRPRTGDLFATPAKHKPPASAGRRIRGKRPVDSGSVPRTGDLFATPAKHEPPAVAGRRIRGKRPVDSGSVLVVASPAKARRLPAVRGHYHVLGVPRESAAAAIRSGYRRQARAAHPDKGGDAERFNAVAEAFEVLSDAAARCVYDRELDARGCSDGGWVGGVDAPAAEPAQPAERAEARLVLERILEAAMHGEAASAALRLMAMRLMRSSMLQAVARACVDIESSIGSSTSMKACILDREDSPGSQGAQRTKYICRHIRNAYFEVTITVAGMMVVARTYSLDEAIDMHIALVEMKSKALERLQRNSSADPITSAEVSDAFCRVPGMALTFRNNKKKYGRNLYSPWVQALSMANRMHRELDSLAKDRPSDERIMAAKGVWKEEAEAMGQQRRDLLRALPLDIEKELKSRTVAEAFETPEKQIPVRPPRPRTARCTPSPERRGIPDRVQCGTFRFKTGAAFDPDAAFQAAVPMRSEQVVDLN